MQKVSFYRQFIAFSAAVSAQIILLVTNASAGVPDTYTYWKNLSAMEKVAKQHLGVAQQVCRRSGNEAEAALKEWKSSLQSGKYSGSDFNPCSGSGTLVADTLFITAVNGRALRLTEKGNLQTDWDFRAHTIRLWYGGDLISLSASPISASIVNASLTSFGTNGKSGPALENFSEEQIIVGLETIWRSARAHYPNHSLYDVALQVITGKDEGREMLLDYIRCGKSICE